ncbi:MAG: hypothetical protein ACRD3B_19850 [Candidatus Sulfotelmatobacter sp.]
MKINVHIERLVLDSGPIDHPRLVQRALEQELTHRLTEGRLPSELHRNAALPYVDGGAIEVDKGLPAAKLGSRVAGAVYRGIGGKE